MLYSIKEACCILGIDRSTFIRWMVLGVFPVFIPGTRYGDYKFGRKSKDINRWNTYVSERIILEIDRRITDGTLRFRRERRGNQELLDALRTAAQSKSI